MSASTPAPATLSTHRIEAFSDGVFAIVMTLLVFDLKVPQVQEGLIEIELLHHLVAMWPQLLSFVLSFVIVGIFWVAHHNMFHHIKRSNRTFIWINNLFLMCVAFIPFPTALMGKYVKLPVAVVPYGLSLIVTQASLLLLWWYATSGRRLVATDLDPKFIRSVYVRIARGMATYAAAILLSIASSRLTLAIYALVPVLYIIPNRMDRHLTAHPTTSDATRT